MCFDISLSEEQHLWFHEECKKNLQEMLLNAYKVNKKKLGGGG